MKTPPVIAKHVCVHCGASSQIAGGKCWLCSEDKAAPNPYADDPIETPKQESSDLHRSPPNYYYQESRNDKVFTVILIVCFMLTLLIGVGLAIQDRGLLIPYAIFIGPTFVITTLKGMISSGREFDPASMFKTMAVSIAVTIAAIILLSTAAIVLAFIVCIQILSRMHH